MRYADGPTAEVMVHIDALPEHVWTFVTDINMPARFSDEFKGGRWIDRGPQLGATFAGRNAHPARGEWETTSTITACEAPLRFGWTVGDTNRPSATWVFELEADGEGTRLRQRARMGPGPSGLSPAIEAMPDKEERIVARRLSEWERNMQATVVGIKAAAEARLPGLRREDVEEAGRRLWDSITETRGASVVDAAGGLVGPFNAWLYAPAIGAQLSDLGAALRFGTSLDRRLLELAVITVAARWKAEFEWWAHARMALEQGVDEAVVEAIGAGQDPPLTAADEQAVFAVARQLASRGDLDTPTYRAAVDLLGDQGVVELVALCGYYTLVSFMLNAFRVPLPAGERARWER